jgi:hypothetical protein
MANVGRMWAAFGPWTEDERGNVLPRPDYRPEPSGQRPESGRR